MPNEAPRKALPTNLLLRFIGNLRGNDTICQQDGGDSYQSYGKSDQGGIHGPRTMSHAMCVHRLEADIGRRIKIGSRQRALMSSRPNSSDALYHHLKK